MCKAGHQYNERPRALALLNLPLLLFFEEIKPLLVMQYISIVTDDDIMHIGDDVNINPVYLSMRAIISLHNHLNWLDKTIVLDHIFCQFLVS